MYFWKLAIQFLLEKPLEMTAWQDFQNKIHIVTLSHLLLLIIRQIIWIKQITVSLPFKCPLIKTGYFYQETGITIILVLFCYICEMTKHFCEHVSVFTRHFKSNRQSLILWKWALYVRTFQVILQAVPGKTN